MLWITKCHRMGPVSMTVLAGKEITYKKKIVMEKNAPLCDGCWWRSQERRRDSGRDSIREFPLPLFSTVENLRSLSARELNKNE